MKVIPCFDCGAHIEAGTMEEMLLKVRNHYQKSHSSMMEEGNEEKQKTWFHEYEHLWKNTPEVSI